MFAMILATSLKAWAMLVGAVLLAAVVLGCYLRAPVAYDLTGNQLTVRFRLGEKVFAPVTRCSVLSARLSWGVRLWGNGGLFGYYGLFTTSRLGKCTWYVTSRSKAVVVVTDAKTTLFSPDDPASFIAAVRSAALG